MIRNQENKQLSANNNQQNISPAQLTHNFTQIFDVGPVLLPEGTDVKKNSYGYCYVATRQFKKGEVIYKCDYVVVPYYVNQFKFSINGTQYFCDQNNSVRFGDERCLYTCGSFINHCCEENSYTIEIDEIQFQVACRDIHPGQEITTNYFHYDFDGFNFKCLCKSPNCYGEINGFKNLSLDKKIKVLPRTLPCIKQNWLKSDKNVQIIEDIKIPQGFYITSDKEGHKLTSKQQFKKGDVLFRLKKDFSFCKDLTIIYKFGEIYEEWKQKEEFSYFLSFIPRCSEPNCSIILENGEYIGLALKDIQNKEQINCRLNDN